MDGEVACAAELDVGHRGAVEIGDNRRPIDLAGRLSHGGASRKCGRGPMLPERRDSLNMHFTRRLRFTSSLAKTAGRIVSSGHGPVPRDFGARANSSARALLLTMRRERKLSHCGVEVSQELIRRSNMLMSKPDQFIKDRTTLLSAGVLEGHPAGHHLVGDPAEPTGGLDTDAAGVLAFEPPSRSQDREVFITLNQIICNRKDRGSQVAIGMSDQPPSRRSTWSLWYREGNNPARPVIARALAYRSIGPISPAGNRRPKPR